MPTFGRQLGRVVMIVGVCLAAREGTSAISETTPDDSRTLTAAERAAVEALDDGRFARARTLAERALAEHPDSAIGQYALGVALKDGDGNLPLGLRALQRARALIEITPGRPRPGDERWHRDILLQLAYALSDLGHYGELLQVHAELRERYLPTFWGADVWPLMKLGRIAEARAAAARAIAGSDPYQEHIARNGLCALDGYPACLEMVRAARAHDLDLGLALRNAGVSAIEVGELEAAERLLIESTENPDGDTNPYRDLLSLYTEQARLAEAADAGRRMVAFGRYASRRQRQYSRGGELTASGALLLVAGHPERALAASARALLEPDRAAHWSGTSGELGAEVALLDRAARLTLAQRCEEVGAVLPWYRSAAWQARATMLRLSAWITSRAITPLALQGGLRPRDTAEERERPQLGAPRWLIPDALALFGAGPADALLAQVRRAPLPPDSTVPPAQRAADLDALEAEVSWLRGRHEQVLESGARARAALPASLRLLRARLAALMAASAWELGRSDESYALYAEVLESDPGTLRRLALSLPIAASDAVGGAASEAARRVARTPRFREDPNSPFHLTTSGELLCLAGPSGVRFACARDPGRRVPVAAEPAPESANARSGPPPPVALPRPGDLDDPAQRLALALLEAAFAPRIDLSQSDLATLDGSPVAERSLSDESADAVLDLDP